MSEIRKNFKISSALKDIIGKDLITDDFVAIFELVKNSFDAHAKNVDMYFGNNVIYIIDDGKGMTEDEVSNKWLFVAYSAKKEGVEDIGLSKDYRNTLKAKRGAFAGNKGVGRFSCDRLGQKLKLQTRSERAGKQVDVLDIDWDKFEVDSSKQFDRIGLGRHSSTTFELPDDVKFLSPNSGTILEIKELRSRWDRDKLLRLRRALAKLVNPFGNEDEFTITVHAPNEEENDETIRTFFNESSITSRADRQKQEVNVDSPYVEIVNGPVRNLVFETLARKTTRIKVELVDGGKNISTELVDRGELILRIREPSPYKNLFSTQINVTLYYLNRIAKTNFTRIMGVEPVNFGNVFLFNNGYRVYPVGEPRVDVFGLDSRKQQGYARHLGTRDLLGRIDVWGTSEQFKESSSRDKGLINTSAYEDLVTFFTDKAVKRFEKYVVDVTWKDKLDPDEETIKRIATDQGKSRVVKLISALSNAKDIEILEYSPRLVDIIDEKSQDFESTLSHLMLIADRTGDASLTKRVSLAAEKYREAKAAQQAAFEKAEHDRHARLKAESHAREEQRLRREEEEKRKRIEKAYEEERKRSLFLASVSTLDYDTVLNLHHQIGIYASYIHHLLESNIDKLRHGELTEPDELMDVLEKISFKNKQIHSIARIATKANFRLDSEEIEADLPSFLAQYIDEISSVYLDGVSVTVNNESRGYIRRFRPIELSMVVDNLLNNSEKSGATHVNVEISDGPDKFVDISFSDDGNGFGDEIEDLDRLFEKGVSTTDGSGLGLYHVKQVVNEMGGGVSAVTDYKDGAKFTIRFAR